MFDTLLTVWVLLAVAAFGALLKIPAPYGRHRRDRWGPTIRAPQGWVLMELPSPVILTAFVVVGNQEKTAVVWFFVALWWVHYVNRSVIYPLRIRNSTTRIPISVVCLGVLFHVFNGYLNGHYFGEVGPAYELSWLTSGKFVVGGSLFLFGFWVNVRSDLALLEQKKEAGGQYVIPKGGLFEYVSSPNYFGEIVEWVGFAIMTWSVAAGAFAIWTIANLAPRAVTHHRWYRETFADYPKRRKALVPFIV